jgi:hypothetical protein
VTCRRCCSKLHCSGSRWPDGSERIGVSNNSNYHGSISVPEGMFIRFDA